MSESGATAAARTRSGIFLESDLTRAAEDAAFALEDHGLSSEETLALSEKLAAAIRDFFAKRRDQEEL